MISFIAPETDKTSQFSKSPRTLVANLTARIAFRQYFVWLHVSTCVFVCSTSSERNCYDVFEALMAGSQTAIQANATRIIKQRMLCLKKH